MHNQATIIKRFHFGYDISLDTKTKNVYNVRCVEGYLKLQIVFKLVENVLKMDLMATGHLARYCIIWLNRQ